jgi:hypothetical protein
MLDNLVKHISSKIPFRISYIDIKKRITRQHLIYIIISICIQVFLHYNSYILYNKINDIRCTCGIEDSSIDYIYKYSIFKVCLMIFLLTIYIAIYYGKYKYISSYETIIKVILMIDIAFLIYWTYKVYIYYNNVKYNCNCSNVYNLEIMYYYSILIISAITLGLITYIQNFLLTKGSEYIDYGISETYDKITSK